MYLTVQGKSISGNVTLCVKVNRDWQRTLTIELYIVIHSFYIPSEETTRPCA